jgi:hypothetical protein
MPIAGLRDHPIRMLKPTAPGHEVGTFNELMIGAKDVVAKIIVGGVAIPAKAAQWTLSPRLSTRKSPSSKLMMQSPIIP